MEKQRNKIMKGILKKGILKKSLYTIIIIIMMLKTFLNQTMFLEPVFADIAQTPVEEEEIFYKEADLFDYDRWDWNFANYYDAWFYIQMEQPEYWLRLAVDDDNNVYVADKEDGAKSQMWHFHYNDDCNAFIIENVYNNSVLSQTGFQLGDNVKTEDLQDTDKEKQNINWKVISNKDNTFRIATMQNEGFVLDVESSDSSEPHGDSNVHLWTDAKTNNQKWKLVPVSVSTYDKALLYMPFQSAYIGEADYNNINVTTGIMKDELSDDGESIVFNNSISNPFSFFYNSDYSKYSDSGTYNGYADYGGLKPYEGTALRNYSMPYMIHNDGWYEFDSRKYYVVKDDNQKKLIPYDRDVNGNVQKVISDEKEREGFFPFNGQGVTEANYGFGMRTKLDFAYMDDGYIKYMDENDKENPIKSQAMEFKFSGDDDLWIFIDGKLILDIGGIHGRTEGSINFATKKSYVNGIEQMDFRSFFDTSKQNHTLYVFYLERCPYDSNLKIMFNLLMEHQITYHSNDGMNDIFQETVINKPQIDIKENMFQERKGYIFKGWNTKADGSGVFVQPNSEWILQKDLDCFAQWEKEPEILYTITLDGNYGVLKTIANKNQDLEKNDKIYVNYTENIYNIYTYDTYVEVHKNNMREGTYKAEREGYTFQGFYTQKDGGRQIISSSGEILVDANVFTEDTTLYAQWTPNTDTKYRVNHWIQNLRGTADLYDSVNYTLKETDNLIGTTESFVTPQVKEYTGFTYAYAKGSNQEGILAPQKANVQIDGDGTTVVDYYYTRNYYRVGGYWTSSNTFAPVITKGNGIESTTGSGLYPYEEEVTVSILCKQGYHWDVMDSMYPSGWYVVPDTLDVNMNNSTVTFTMPANDVYFHATATNNRYKVIFDDNGGYFGPKEMELVYDKTSILPQPPIRFGFDFLHWTVGNKNYYVGQGVKNLTSVQDGQVTMTAQWKQKRFQLIKIASSMYGKTMVKRTIGDDYWYNLTGKWTLKEICNAPTEQCIQKWNINEDGVIKRIC